MAFGISIWWIMLAVAVYFGLGALWYSPVLFLKPWQEELRRRRSDEPTMAASAMAATVVAILVLVLVEAYIIQHVGVRGWSDGAVLGAKLWLGFVATTTLINHVFQSGSRRLYLIDQGYHLAGLI